jgi:uncharacterized Zn finger protein
MSFRSWAPYVPVAKRRAQAEKAAAKAKKAGKDLRPVVIEGSAIAKTFWGKAWCKNLEAYSDLANRLPRGRSYVRNGSVVDLKIEPGKVRAQVMGSHQYTIEIGIKAVPNSHWKLLATECTGSIASLVELLQGKLSNAVMERICQQNTGLFPALKDIKLECSCPDGAAMCKHLAAVLYGIGARLDTEPNLLFALRQVDANDLVTQAAQRSINTGKTPARGKLLDDSQLADVFGIEMDSPKTLPNTTKKTPTRQTKPLQPATVAAKTPTKTSAKKKKVVVAAVKKLKKAESSSRETTAQAASRK